MNRKRYTLTPERYRQIFHVCCVFPLIFLAATSSGKAVTLFCPSDFTVQLSAGQCGTEVFFEDLEWSSTEELTDTVFFPASGSFFEIGNNVITLAVTDVNGDLEVCTFNLLILEFATSELNCIENVQISLNGTCSREIQSQELIFTNLTGCQALLDVLRLSPSGVSLPPVITANDIGSTFLAVVQHSTNGQQCLTQVTVNGGTPPSITCPPKAFILCNEPVDSSNTGVPTLTGCYQNVTLEYFDHTSFTFCPDSVAFQIDRSWVSTDPFGKKDTCEQLITGFRYEIDLVDFPPSFDGNYAPKLQCVDTMTLAEMTATSRTGIPTFVLNPVDASPHCKVNASYIDQVTHVCGGSYIVRRSWAVAKICAPSATRRDTQYIHVVDTIGPQFSIPDSIYVSLNSDCGDSLLLPQAANVVECAGYSVEIRTPWDTLTTNGGWAQVELIPGTYPVIYTLTDECGNVTLDTSMMLVQNGTLISCPPDTTVSCDYYFDTLLVALALSDEEVLGRLGMPVFPANCDYSVTETDSVEVDICGSGFLVRTLVSNASQPQTCVQEVTIVHVSDFDVQFPTDRSYCTSPGNTNTGEPIIANGSCETLTMIPLDNIVPGDVNGCYTIYRTWQVTNGCVYTGVNNFDDSQLDSLHFADGGDGIVEFLQTIEVNASTGPAYPKGCEIPDLFLPPNSCELTMTVPTPEVRACGPFSLGVGGALGNLMGADVTLGPGGYNVTYTATDECGKVKTCNTFFEVRDTVPPVVVCKTGLVIELPQNSSTPIVEVWVNDFVESAMDNCSLSGSVAISFSAMPGDIGRTYGCCDVGQIDVEVFATDSHGNTGTCSTSFILQSPIGCEPCGPEFSGTCQTTETEGIAQVMVTVQAMNGFNQTTTTDTAGYFEVKATDAEFGADFAITPSKNINHKNGVTTFDGVLITRHILGTVPLNSPYLLIAADVNNSGAVTTFDIVEMRKLILNVTQTFPNNTSWRFVPSDFEFPNPLNPWSTNWPAFIQVNDVVGDEPDLNFIGIKIGDLNSSADPDN